MQYFCPRAGVCERVFQRFFFGSLLSCKHIYSCDVCTVPVNVIINVFLSPEWKVFNVENYPPPARAEFTAANEWGADCDVVVKCVAALPE